MKRNTPSTWLELTMTLLAITSIWASAVQLTVLDFEGLREDSSDIPKYQSYMEDGFLLSYLDLDPAEGPDGIAVVGTQHPGFFGSTAVFPPSNIRLELTRIGGGTFNVASVALIEHFPDFPDTRSLEFFGERPDGSVVSQRLYADEVLGFETLSFVALNGIEKLYWSWEHPNWTQHSIRVDDLTLSDMPSVPDSGSSAMLLVAGLGVLCLARRSVAGL